MTPDTDTVRTAPPSALPAQLEAARKKLAVIEATQAAKQAEIDEAVRIEREAVERQERLEREARLAEESEVAELRAEVARVEAQVEAQRLAAIREQVESSPEALSFWARAEEAYVNRGPVPPIEVLAEDITRKTLGVAVHRDLWQIEDSGVYADTEFLGMPLRAVNPMGREGVPGPAPALYLTLPMRFGGQIEITDTFWLVQFKLEHPQYFTADGRLELPA